MILCPTTGRKPWMCMCPEHVAQRLALGPDVSPTPNRQVGWARPRAVILSDAPVRIAGGAITRGLYFFSRWKRAPGGDILFGADGQPQKEGGPGDSGVECCVEERSRTLLAGAMHVASVKPPTVAQLFRTANSEYFALRTYDGEYTFSVGTLDQALKEMHEQNLKNTPEKLNTVVSETVVHTPRHWVERAYPMLVTCGDLIAGARALLFVPPSESIELRTNDAQEEYVVRWRGGVHPFDRPVLYRRAAEIAKTKGDDELAADILRSIGGPGDGSLWPEDVLDQFKDLFERHRAAGTPGQAHNLRALGLRPQPGPQREFMAAGIPGTAKNCGSLLLPDPQGVEEWARNGEWRTDAQHSALVFSLETDPHLVARAVHYMWSAGLGQLEDETFLYYSTGDDSYLIRQYCAASDHLRGVNLNSRTLLGYTVPPGSIRILELAGNHDAVHRSLETSTKRKIPPAELRAWLLTGSDRVFCAWGSGVATISAQCIAERSLQKTGESPTMASAEPPTP